MVSQQNQVHYEYSKEEIEMAFKYFVLRAKEICDEYMEENFPSLSKYNLAVDEGSKYWKIVQEGTGRERGRRSVYGFVRKSDGAIFRAASFRAPQTKGKNAVRALVTDEWATGVLTPHGIAYSE
jgi:hypothetical protein